MISTAVTLGCGHNTAIRSISQYFQCIILCSNCHIKSFRIVFNRKLYAFDSVLFFCVHSSLVSRQRSKVLLLPKSATVGSAIKHSRLQKLSVPLCETTGPALGREHSSPLNRDHRSATGFAKQTLAVARLSETVTPDLQKYARTKLATEGEIFGLSVCIVYRFIIRVS